jgi:hypothetical protein
MSRFAAARRVQLGKPDLQLWLDDVRLRRSRVDVGVL